MKNHLTKLKDLKDKKKNNEDKERGEKLIIPQFQAMEMIVAMSDLSCWDFCDKHPT